MQQEAYCQNERDLDFLIVGDCTREFLYNNFLFGCAKGMWFIPDANGGSKDCHSLGNAVDGAVQTFVIDGIASDLDFVNSQIVALDHDPDKDSEKHRLEISSYIPATFIKTGEGLKGRTVTFFSSNNWGGGDYMLDVASGKVVVAMTNMNASGEVYTFKTGDEARIEIFNGRFNNMKRTLASVADAPRVGVATSVIEYKTGNRPADMKWDFNLLPAWELADLSGLEPRQGWKATASVNNGNAYRAIDGDSSSRWDTGRSQAPGQWFEVDFGKELTFNTVILDASPSGNNDGPAGYEIEVFTGGEWLKVAEGVNGGANCVVTFERQTASKVRVLQTGTKGNYWSIHEFYIADLELSAVESVVSDSGSLRLTDSCIECGSESGVIEVYTLTGTHVLTGQAPRLDISAIPSGVYIAVARTGTGRQTLKFAR